MQSEPRQLQKSRSPQRCASLVNRFSGSHRQRCSTKPVAKRGAVRLKGPAGARMVMEMADRRCWAALSRLQPALRPEVATKTLEDNLREHREMAGLGEPSVCRRGKPLALRSAGAVKTVADSCREDQEMTNLGVRGRME